VLFFSLIVGCWLVAVAVGAGATVVDVVVAVCLLVSLVVVLLVSLCVVFGCVWFG
jgi:hypothetical protein